MAWQLKEKLGVFGCDADCALTEMAGRELEPLGQAHPLGVFRRDYSLCDT